MNGHSPSILMIPQRSFPSDHAFLESVYTRFLPDAGFRISWIMHSDAASEGGIEDWNGTVVHVAAGPSTLPRPVRRVSVWTKILSEMWRRARRPDVDIVQVRNLIGGGLLGLLIRRVRGIPICYQLSFPIPEGLIEAAKAGRTRFRHGQQLIGRVQIWMRTWMIRRVDLVLAISEGMAELILEWGVDPQRVIVTPMGVEVHEPPSAKDVERRRTELRLAGPCVLYFGIVAPERQLSFLIDVASHVQGLGVDATWILLGPSVAGERGRLAAAAVDAGLDDRFRFVDRVPRNELAPYLALASIAVSPIPTTPLFWLSSPTKTVEALGLGVPVVATPIPDQASLLERSGGGVAAAHEVVAFGDAVAGMLGDLVATREMGRRGRDYVLKNRTYAAQADHLSRAYRELVSSQ